MTAARPRIALKIDVDTLRGTQRGVPALARALGALDARATFLLSVGPDHTGRALRRALKPGFLRKVARTSVVEHYGIRTLLYGTLLPGPHIGRTCARELRAVRADGFETGLHAYDHVKWQDLVGARDREWAQRELTRGIEAYGEIFGEQPRAHGAAGWQMSDAAFELEARLGFDYASDTRGTHPFVPVVDGMAIDCPQLPTTLPTVDELLGLNGAAAQDVVTQLLRLTQQPPVHAHVFTVHAELEGLRLLDHFVALLRGWRAHGYELVSLREARERLDPGSLPRHAVVRTSVAGRAGTLAVQGPRV